VPRGLPRLRREAPAALAEALNIGGDARPVRPDPLSPTTVLRSFWNERANPRSVRAIADDRDALHHRALRPVVGGRVVLDGAVVPEGDRARPPVEAALILGDRRLSAEECRAAPRSPRRRRRRCGW
jgi:hypothetical protein